ncbi:MAG: ABC transporter permease [Chloroflexi bacterium]|nr:ABC transporter permease [Chloroflexota bacterium]
MQALVALTIANVRSFVRDRAALFWTMAFPILFVILFGSIFSSSAPSTFDAGWVDEDGTPASAQLRAGFESTGLLTLRDDGLEQSLDAMRTGDLEAVIVVPAGLGAALTAATAGSPPATPVALTLYTDPTQGTTSATLTQVVTQVIGAANLIVAGTPPVLTVTAQAIQTEELGAAAYIVPSILAMALMQLGVFSAIPLVEQREKHILKRLGATPLPRWTLVGSNIVMRLGIALVQALLIVGIGMALFQVQIVGSLLLAFGFVVLGALTFIALGYVIAAFARTEEAANGLTSVIQFPLMFLSGIFFPIAFMPELLQPIAALMPLTYLGDALRQVMVGGTPFVPLWLDALVLAGWLVVCFLISARWFRWE